MQHHALMICILRFVMDTTSLPIFLVYFVEGTSLLLYDPEDRTCGSENQPIILIGFGARTPTKHSTLQVLSSEITNWNNSKMLISGRNTEGIDGNHEHSNSFGNFIYLFSSSWTKPRQGGQNSICSFQPNFISLVSSAGCTSTIYSLEKERHHGTEQYKYQISIDHYWRKQWQVQLWSEETGRSWQRRNPSCHWKWVFFTNKLRGVSFKRNCGAAGRPNDLFVLSFIGMVRSVHEITRWQLSFQSILMHTFREYH